VNLALRLPVFALKRPELLGKGKAFIARVRQHRMALMLLWLAFLVGVLAADMWLASRSVPPSPAAAISIGPLPPPLVLGVDPPDRALPAAPLADLIESTPIGSLPIASAAGQLPRLAYAYPFDPTDARPRISVILKNVGLQKDILAQAIRRLPGSVALAFSVFSPQLDIALNTARLAGHEVLLAIPAEQKQLTGLADPGSSALRDGLSTSENMQRLHLILAKAVGYTGLLLPQNMSLLDDSNFVQALLSDLHRRGLQLLSHRADLIAVALSHQAAAVAIPLDLSDYERPADIDRLLTEAEQRARETGHLVLVSELTPLTLDRLANWLPTLAQKGLALAPASAASPAPEHVAKVEIPPTQPSKPADSHAAPH